MQELNPEQYQRTRPLFAPLSHYLTLDSIFAGLTPGRVFADDVERPQTAVAWYHHRVYVAGRADVAARQQVKALFQTAVIPEATQAGLDAYILHVDAAWAEHVAVALPRLPPPVWARRTYRLDARGRDWEVALPDRFALRPVDADLLADGRIRNPAYLTEEMVSERPSIDDFLAKSFGLCLMRGDEIVGWCLSEYNVGHRCEIGIAVAEPFRKRGLATLMGRAFISYALAQGVHDIGWICWAQNAPSVATAEKLSFALVDERDVFIAFLGGSA